MRVTIELILLGVGDCPLSVTRPCSAFSLKVVHSVQCLPGTIKKVRAVHIPIAESCCGVHVTRLLTPRKKNSFHFGTYKIGVHSSLALNDDHFLKLIFFAIILSSQTKSGILRVHTKITDDITKWKIHIAIPYKDILQVIMLHHTVILI